MTIEQPAQFHTQLPPIPRGIGINKHMANWMRKQRIQIIRKERSRWRNEKKNTKKAIIIGFAPRLPPEISSIIASFIRVPLTKQSSDDLEAMIPTYQKLLRAYRASECRMRSCTTL